MTSLYSQLNAFDSTLMLDENDNFVPTNTDLCGSIVKTCSPSYEFNEFMDKGGEAYVFKIRDWELGKIFRILKIPLPELVGPARDRFSRSIITQAELSSPFFPYVVKRSPKPLFGVFEYVDGIDLRKWTLSKKWFLPKAIDIIRLMLQGLSALHNKNLIHRDIKPDNVVLTPQDHIKIIDFGFAKNPKRAQKCTRTGTAIGHPLYSPPEQLADASNATKASDVYAAGKTMFFLLCRHEGFESESLFDLNLSYKTVSLYQTACDPDPKKRFQNGQEFLNALNAVFPPMPIEIPNQFSIYDSLQALLVLCGGDRHKVELLTGMSRDTLNPMWHYIKKRVSVQCLSVLNQIKFDL